MRQTNGPNYDFFANLLPPLRYVNASFRFYPIVLSAPNAPVKARLISNGSAINALAGLNTWKNAGVPVSFRVGEKGETFGADLRRLDGPHLAEGYLPIVNLAYESDSTVYEEESFAAVSGVPGGCGLVFVKFSLTKGQSGKVSASFDSGGPFTARDGVVSRSGSARIAWHDKRWEWDQGRHELVANLKSGEEAVLAIATKPVVLEAGMSSVPNPLSQGYRAARHNTGKVWRSLVDQASPIETPEPLVNQAWRALLVNNFALVDSDRPNYSAGNAYDRLYQAECSEVSRAFLLYGYSQDAAKQIRILLDYTRDSLKFHNAGFKLQAVAHYYWLTRDLAFVNSTRDKCGNEARLILQALEADSGLLPRERYCGDIETPVYSLHANGACWRGLRDYAAVLASAGDHIAADRLLNAASKYRRAILAAARQSTYTNTQPAFIPVALFGEEKPQDTLTSTMLGSYWCLMAPYMLGSGFLGPGSADERSIIDYLQNHGGVCMGMIRFDQHSGLFANVDALDDLYGLRYTLKLLELDDTDRALVSFYGKLAQGLTRDTFIGAEGTGLRPLDEFGRGMYLPPVSTAQAYWLWMLRYLLVQDWDLDDDGTPETLRLAFATPKAWLEDGKTISAKRLPTAFGPVSLTLKSHLAQGEVLAELELPSRNPAKVVKLRACVPDSWKVTGAKAGAKNLSVDEKGTVDISSLSGKIAVRFEVKSAR